MKDFLKKYENRKKFIWKVYMVLWALITAFSVNFLLFDGTDFEKNLTASIINSNQQEKKADFYLENANWKVFLKNFKNMENVKNISFSLVYDAENIEISEIKSPFADVELLWEKFSGIETVILNFDSKNFSEKEDIVEISFVKKDENKISNLNLLNSNFTDLEENIYNLTTSGISL